MLGSLSIKNFAVIAELNLDLGAGLVVFTGQTGAGKSILIEALGFLLGARGSPDWLRAGASKLEVAGAFDSTDLPKALRDRFDITTPTFTIRRELDAAGKTRALVNQKPLAASALAESLGWLIDFHGQHEHQTLMKPALHLDLLDGFAGLDALREKLGAGYRAWKDLAEQKKARELSQDERLRRIDLYQYQLKEISDAAPKEGEEEELTALVPRLRNAERFSTLSAQVHALLYEQEGSAEETLLKAQRSLEELSKIDPALAADVEALAQARTAIQEIAERAGAGAEAVEGPEALDRALGRLDRLEKLRRKYGATIAEVLAYRDKIQSELTWLEDSQEKGAELDGAIAAARKALDKVCSEAHKARMAASGKLADKILKELKHLGLASARFSVAVEMDDEAVGPKGADQAEFLIAPNPGEPLKPLKSVASGGELSRVMLAIKTVLANADRTPVLVFDEVDTGVGGEIAQAVGKRLADLGAERQVLCVTHLAQVACFGAAHFHVSKEVSGERTFTRVEKLGEETRLEAIARMLGGKELTTTSRKHAKELLEASR